MFILSVSMIIPCIKYINLLSVLWNTLYKIYQWFFNICFYETPCIKYINDSFICLYDTPCIKYINASFICFKRELFSSRESKVLCHCFVGKPRSRIEQNRNRNRIGIYQEQNRIEQNRNRINMEQEQIRNRIGIEQEQESYCKKLR